ncbi:hypothetical protein DM860_005521 [Cuscuta australis]|uniref:XS domain-containing protein n=1 Tax=Cuscuta australis TaxID=267555 RepID=A0A328DZK0_9ASTE|nr:hypothetical protein DM860_005521 [Cuscuta australis]
MSREEDDDIASGRSMAAWIRERGIDLSSDPYLMHSHGMEEADQSQCCFRTPSHSRIGYELSDYKNSSFRCDHEIAGSRAARYDSVGAERLLRASEHEYYRQRLQDKMSGRGVAEVDFDLDGRRSLASSPHQRWIGHPDPNLLGRLTDMEMYGRRERIGVYSKPKGFISSGGLSFRDDMDKLMGTHRLNSAELRGRVFLGENREEFNYEDRCNCRRTKCLDYSYRLSPQARLKEDYSSEWVKRRRIFPELGVSPSRVLNTDKEKLDIYHANPIGCSVSDHCNSGMKFALNSPYRTLPYIGHPDDIYLDSRNAHSRKQNFSEIEMPNLCVPREILNRESDNGDNDASGRSLKRSSSLVDDMNMHGSSGDLSRKLTATNDGVHGGKDEYDGHILLPKRLDHEFEQCKKVCHASEEMWPKQLPIKQDEPRKRHKVGQNPTSIPKNVWIRGNVDKQVEEVHEKKTEESKGALVCYAKIAQSEDSLKFNKLVYNFFLFFTKTLYKDLPTRKRYMEQGKAGSLSCLVCGNRTFKDTQALGAHCFMSQKVDLKAKHLGLLTAICVLMGWNAVVGPNITGLAAWQPRQIPHSAALAQREDLILWPPIVIVQNCTKLSSGPQEHQVTSITRVEGCLRGEGFNTSKLKICLGKPANGSVVVVKFLATASGLKEAEKLHGWFLEKGHGREGFNKQTASEKQEKNHKELDQETTMYGYMGIVEDLDQVDNDTSLRCLVKSKKELDDFVNAPVYS